LSVVKLSTPPFCNETGVGLDYGCLSVLIESARLKYMSDHTEYSDGLTRRNNFFSLRTSIFQIGASNATNLLSFRPQISQDYPLNLSISISGGKETNKDSPSNGE
jgi:hypothetical protein